jgi:hypothetical protein
MSPHLKDWLRLYDFLNTWDTAQHNVACGFLSISHELDTCRDDVVGNQGDVNKSAIIQLSLGSLRRHLVTDGNVPEVLRLKVSLHRMLPGMVVGAIKNGNQGNKSIRHSRCREVAG